MSRLDQAAALRRMGSDRLVVLDPPRRRFIAITGGKGGVGKSAVAVNLAIAYAQRGARCLALDGDLAMADLNLLLGVAPTATMLDVADGVDPADVLVEAHGIHLLPGLNGSDRLAGLSAEDRAHLLGKVDALRARFDTVVFDTAPGVGPMTMEMAASAVDVVLVATSEPLALADAYASLKVLSRKHNVDRVMVLPNMVRTPSEGDEIIARLGGLVERFLPLRIVPLPPVPFDPAVVEAASIGVPVVLHCPDSAAARTLKRVARRIDALGREDVLRPTSSSEVQ